MDTALKVPLSQRINIRMIIFAAVLVAPVAWLMYVFVDAEVTGGVKNHGSYLEVDLKAMSVFPFDQVSGTINDIPPQWRNLDGKRVEVEGEMWAPQAASPEVTHFELVYSKTKCCFSGPPQIQHFVQCKTKPADPVGLYDNNRVKAIGTLHVKVTHDEGRITGIYHLDIESVEPLG